MNIGFHHYHQRTSHSHGETHNNIYQYLIDKLVYIGGTVGIFIMLPQLAKIWMDKNVTGLSLITWLGFLGGAIFWIVYGIIHKEKPLIFINVVASFINFLIVLGIILFGSKLI